MNFAPDSRVSQRVLFPSAPSQSNGIEDARFVRFQNDDGSFTYYATYTAYDGKIILPQLLETPDFLHFKFSTLNGPAVQNKGMALFPRKINGQYVMLSRQDDENILLMFSDNIHFWQTPKLLLPPAQPWEFIKIGNCGSPIETEAGWLVLSHGVGAMRKYCLGAFLLDLNDPTRVIGRLREPLLSPERIGARRLCAERGLHLRRAAARTRTHHPLRHERLRHQLRHRVPGRTAGRDGVRRGALT